MVDPKVNTNALLASCTLLATAANKGLLPPAEAEAAIADLVAECTQHIEPLRSIPDGYKEVLRPNTLDWAEVDDAKCLRLTR